MIVTLTPNPSLDRTLFLDSFTRGAVNRCTATLTEPSGKGINVALALHSHGVPVLAVLPIAPFGTIASLSAEEMLLINHRP